MQSTMSKKYHPVTVNYGCLLLNALLEHWQYSILDEEKEEIAKEQNNGAVSCLVLGTLQIPPHTPIIFT